MRSLHPTRSVSKGGTLCARLSALGRDRRGTTAIEFAMVSLPFLMFSFGIIIMAMHYLTTIMLDRAALQASRKIRTGEVVTENMTVGDFKQLVCEEASPTIACNDKLQVHIQSADAWADINPRNCLESGSLASPGTSEDDLVSQSSGGASQVVLVTLCYEWTLPQNMPYIELGNMSNGSQLIQSVATFRSEPYPES